MSSPAARHRAWLFSIMALAACGGSDGGGGDNGGTGPPPAASFSVLGGGNNVPDRYTSDLWVHGGWAYTGTWGAASRNGVPGNAVKIWRLDGSGAPRWPTRSSCRPSPP